MVIRVSDLNTLHDAITNAFVSNVVLYARNSFRIDMQKCSGPQVQLFSSYEKKLERKKRENVCMKGRFLHVARRCHRC